MTGKKLSYSSFHRSLLRWYAGHQRSLPWRATRNPYFILLSEIMLQQTQVNRVVDYYKHWVKKFPSFLSLSKASRADVLRAWSGLGYNNRALRLRQLAHIVVTHYRSKLPPDIEQLQKLPGIGKYTAHAIACFAFSQQVPVVDVNVKRILTRWTRKEPSLDKLISDAEAWILAVKFLPRKNAYAWNQALMDLGSRYCTARNPQCSECPIKTYCASAFSKSFLRSVTKAVTKEPSWKGIPRRLYRGRILKLLHYHTFSSREIASHLWKVASERDVRWLEQVLDTMCNDGLLNKSRTRYSIAE